MTMLLEINPNLDRGSLAARFATKGRLQITDLLTERSAERVRQVLVEETPWCLAWQAGASGTATLVKAAELEALSPAEREAIAAHVRKEGETYGFVYQSYPLVTAYLEHWRPGSPQERLLEELNSAPFLAFMREVTGIAEIVKMDGQATLYGPGHFLWPHSDAESERGRRVAYVLNLTLGEWRPQWGGYLNFFDDRWDIERAIRPLFNSLNLFRVPQWHSVGEVSSAAPPARYAITGWARDR